MFKGLKSTTNNDLDFTRNHYEVYRLSRDQVIGSVLVLVSAVIIVIYGWLVFIPPEWLIFNTPIDLFVLKLTGFIAVAGVFGILGWIGYTLATTPPPKPIEEIEKELEGELEKLESEVKSEGKEENSKT